MTMLGTRIGVAQSFIPLTFEGGWPDQLAYPTVGGLVAAADGGESACIFTGIDTGYVHVLTARHNSQPELTDEDQWEDIVWITIYNPTGTLFVIGTFGDGVTENFSPGPGRVRIRCSARGRDVAHRNVLEGDSEEYYRVDAWPVAPGDRSASIGVVKLESATSKYVMKYHDQGPT